MLNFTNNRDHNVLDSLFKGAGKLTGFAMGGVAAAGSAGFLYLNHLQSVYGAEQVWPLMAVRCGSGGAVVVAIVIGGRVFWKYYQSLDAAVDDGAAVEAVSIDDWVDFMAAQYHPRRNKVTLPLGFDISTGSLVEMKTDEGEPHLLVSGKTGTGKSKAVLRPLALMAANIGYQVVILDKSGKDFGVLKAHPNIFIVPYDVETLAPMVAATYQEVIKRLRFLASLSSNPGSIAEVKADKRPHRILVIIDEYGNVYNLLREMDKTAAGTMNVSAIQVAQEGRAVGVHLVVATQRADSTQVNTTLRSSLKPITFRVRDLNDEKIAATPGAASLKPGEAIFASDNGDRHLKMYYPTNEELEQVIAIHAGVIRNSTRQVPEPTWLGEHMPVFERPPLTVPVVERGDTPENGTGQDAAEGRDLMQGYGLVPGAEREKTHAPIRERAGTAVSPPATPSSNGDSGIAQIIERMTSFLLEDDGTPHPRLPGATVSQARAASYGLTNGLTSEVVKRVIRQHLEAEELLMAELRAALPIADEIQPTVTQATSPPGGTEKLMQVMLQSDAGVPMVFNPGENVPDELSGISMAMYMVAKIGLENKLGVTAVARELFPNVKSPNNKHKGIVRAVRNREGLPVLDSRGNPVSD